MDRHAIFVDAGYFFAAGAQAAFNVNTPRKIVSIKSPDILFAALSKKTSEISDGLPLLRAYWYDAMPGPRLSLEQNSLAKLNGVKLRMGALNSAGEQKGVDSLIVTDLIDLARNRAIADAVLVSGDEDLRIAVQIAQSFGVRVHVLAAGDPSKNVSPALQMEADSVNSLDSGWFLEHFERKSSEDNAKNECAGKSQASTATGSSQPLVTLEKAAIAVVNEILEELDSEQLPRLNEHFTSSTSVPPEYDRKLVARVSTALANRRLNGDEMRHIRGVFVKAVRVRANPAL